MWLQQKELGPEALALLCLIVFFVLLQHKLKELGAACADGIEYTLNRLSYRDTILGWKLGRASWVSGDADGDAMDWGASR